jgi:hypothetical protein
VKIVETDRLERQENAVVGRWSEPDAAHGPILVSGRHAARGRNARADSHPESGLTCALNGYHGAREAGHGRMNERG